MFVCVFACTSMCEIILKSNDDNVLGLLVQWPKQKCRACDTSDLFCTKNVSSCAHTYEYFCSL